MSTISANTLFHFTNSKENLISILKYEFYPRYSLEEYTLGKKTIEAAFPIVCFCDMPLSQIKDNHLKTYGRYGIGMSKKWAKKKGLNPVLYLKKKSTISHTIETSAFNLLNKLEEIETVKELRGGFVEILRYVKPCKGNLYKNGKVYRKDISFYDEREWRYVLPPEKCEGEYFLTKKEWQNPDTRKQENKKLEKQPLGFEPSDIKYIIVKKEKEILAMVKTLRETKSKYSYGIVEKLTTRIITSKQIEEDF